jgi:UrcA family protein
MKTNAPNSFRRVLVGAALVAGFATAAQSAELPQVRVNYADLNVNSTAGAAVLYQRIRSAADQVCPTFGERDLGAQAVVKACKVRAVGEAVAAVHSAALTQVLEGKIGVTPAERVASL